MSLITPKTIVITAYPGNHGISMQQNKSEFSYLGDSTDFDSDGGGSGPRKRRRLNHLTPDEKMLRRKLKNRVAAQTARDRKKALMQELEEKVAQLEEENKLLRRQNLNLKETSTSLAQENASLKTRLSSPVCVPIKTEPESIRSAAPAVPLQKEQVQTLSCWMTQYCAVMMVMMSVVASSAFMKTLQAAESSSSRKRKQLRPARRILEESPEQMQVVPMSGRSVAQCKEKLWLNQKSLNPSKT